MPTSARKKPRRVAKPKEVTEPFDQIEDAGAEDEGDLRGQVPGKYEGAVLTATDWTASTLVSQLVSGNIDLQPAFQRRDAWGTGSKKSRFIESLFLGLPVPQLVLAQRKDERGKFLVLDGKQRLLALRQFTAEPDGSFVPLALQGLEIRKDLNGKTYAALKADPRFDRDVTDFENQTVRTVVVRNWPDEKYLYTVFLRLNTGTVPLSPQELRQALHPGPFVTFADEYAASSNALRRVLGTTGPDFRMRDVELLVRFYGFARYLKEYDGDLKSFLDTTCQRLNSLWSNEQSSIRDEAAQCEQAIEATYLIFESFAFRRWNGTAFEPRFNRAVFDVMTYYFRDQQIARLAVANRAAVVTAFKRLMARDGKYVESVLTTTKSKGATAYRLRAWGRVLGLVVKEPLARRVPLRAT